MSRTAGLFCLRSNMPDLPDLDTDETAESNIPTSTPIRSDADAMTWQQQTDFGDLAKPNRRNPGRVRWKPFDHDIVESQQSTALNTDKSWSAQQAEFPTPPTSTPRPRRQRQARGKAATSAKSPHLANPPAPAKPSHLESIIISAKDNTNDAHKLQEPPRKKSSRRKKPKAKDNDMTPLRKEAYVPPHLRKRKSASGAKVDSAQSGITAKGSPAASDQSKATIQSKLHSSQNGTKHVGDSPPSPPTTPQEPAHPKLEKHNCCDNSLNDPKPAKPNPAEPQHDVYSGWDEPKPNLPVRGKNAGNPRWPRGLQPQPAYKKNVWPKNSEMKYVPASSGSDTDGGVTFKSNSGGDPDYDVKKLLDWNGDWLPAPESWSARKGHTNRHFGQWIEDWMNGQAADCSTPVSRPPGTFVDDAGICKELAPRYWMDAKVENSPMREYWKSFFTAEPKPLEECNIMENPPWWERYEDMVYEDEDEHTKNLSCYLTGLVVPEARVNLTDPDHPTLPIHLASAEEKVVTMKRRADEKYRRTMAKRNRPVPESKFPMPQIADRSLKPTANIYIRPVQAADVRGIAELYNYYVANTIHTNEFDARTEQQIAHRINDVIQTGLPYLVAISKSNQSKATPGYVTEKIVGYINLDDYCDQASLWRYTFQLDIFVHPGFTGKGIGKCLMDRLLEMVDTSYRARGGYEYVNHFEYLKTGPSRVVKTILINVHHVNGVDPQEEWQGKFMKDCTFSRVGRLPLVGYKQDQAVDVSIYAHHTKEHINAAALPTVAG